MEHFGFDNPIVFLGQDVLELMRIELGRFEIAVVQERQQESHIVVSIVKHNIGFDQFDGNTAQPGNSLLGEHFLLADDRFDPEIHLGDILKGHFGFVVLLPAEFVGVGEFEEILILLAVEMLELRELDMGILIEDRAPSQNGILELAHILVVHPGAYLREVGQIVHVILVDARGVRGGLFGSCCLEVQFEHLASTAVVGAQLRSLHPFDFVGRSAHFGMVMFGDVGGAVS